MGGLKELFEELTGADDDEDKTDEEQKEGDEE